MPQYHLSKNQIADLIESAKMIRIAMPLSPDFSSGDYRASQDELHRWASQMLPPTIAVFISHAEIRNVLVSPMFVAKPSTLTELLGVIQEVIRPDRFTFAIRSCIATLDPPGRRGVSDRVQWPKDFVIAGKSVLIRTETHPDKSSIQDSPTNKPKSQPGAGDTTAASRTLRETLRPKNS